MAKREGFQVPATIVTPDDSDTWAVAEANDIKGGLHSVKTKEDLKSISEARQMAGMTVYVQDEDKYYEKRNDSFVERKEVVENEKPWTTDKTIHADNYGATLVVPYVFMSNPKYLGLTEGEPNEYSAVGISSDDVIVDSKMNAYTAQEFKTAVIEVDDKGFKLISKLIYDELKNTELAPGVEPFDAIADKDNPAIIKPYALKEGDKLRGQNIVRTAVDDTEQLVDSIVNVHVKNLKKLNEITKNEDGTYSAGSEFPLVFVNFNEDDSNVALGKNIRGVGLNTVSIGTEAASLGAGAVSYGHKASSTAPRTIAAGEESAAKEREAVAIGAAADAEGTSAVALGANAKAKNSRVIAAGVDAVASGANSIALGANAEVYGRDSIAIGNMNGNAKGERSVAIGSGTKAEADATIAFGYAAAAKEKNSVAIGSEAEVMGKNSVALGAQSKAYDTEMDVISVGAQEFGGKPEYKRRIVHVADGINASDAVTKKQLDDVAAKVPEVPEDAKFTDTTYELAVAATADTEGKAGLMSAEDKAKLNALKNVDYSQFMEKPAGDDQYLLRSEAEKAYAPAQNDYLQESDIEERFTEYAKKKDIDGEVKKYLFADEDGTQPIYAKADEVITAADVTKEVTTQFESLMKVPSGGEDSKLVDKYAVKDELGDIINKAIEEYLSKHVITIDDKNQILIGGLSGDGVKENTTGTEPAQPETPPSQEQEPSQEPQETPATPENPETPQTPAEQPATETPEGE